MTPPKMEPSGLVSFGIITTLTARYGSCIAEYLPSVVFTRGLVTHNHESASMLQPPLGGFPRSGVGPSFRTGDLGVAPPTRLSPLQGAFRSLASADGACSPW